MPRSSRNRPEGFKANPNLALSGGQGVTEKPHRSWNRSDCPEPRPRASHQAFRPLTKPRDRCPGRPPPGNKEGTVSGPNTERVPFPFPEDFERVAVRH